MKPVQIVAVEPAKGAVVQGDAILRVRLDLRGGPRPLVPRSLRLLLDGKDVTGDSRIAFTEDIPPSQGEISYQPREPLAPGEHHAEVQLADDAEEPLSYAWAFTVASPSQLAMSRHETQGEPKSAWAQLLEFLSKPRPGLAGTLGYSSVRKFLLAKGAKSPE